MVSCTGKITIVSLLLLTASVVGCAKRPATTQATAPAPAGAAGVTAPGSVTPGTTTVRPAPGATTPGTGMPGTATPGTATRPGAPGATVQPGTPPGAQPGTPPGAQPGTQPGAQPEAQPGAQAATPATAAPGTPGSTARPTPREFVAVPDLADIYFDFDRYDIRPGDAQVLDANVQWLKANPGQLLLIEGHCDERGTNEYNLALGERRAKSAMNYLVAQGIQASRITIISYGEERPACAEKNESCWSRNRRAHFLVKGR